MALNVTDICFIIHVCRQVIEEGARLRQPAFINLNIAVEMVVLPEEVEEARHNFGASLVIPSNVDLVLRSPRCHHNDTKSTLNVVLRAG